MLFPLAIALLLSTSTEAAAIKPIPVVMTRQVERLVIPVASTVRAYPMRGVIRLKAKKANVLYQALVDQSTLCPTVRQLKNNRIELVCKTRKIEARIRKRGGKRTLIITERLGAPVTRGRDAMPIIFLEPSALSMGGPCPGDNAVSRGECALAAHHFKKARKFFQVALTGSFHAFAALRLGDLALRKRKFKQASAYYKAVGRKGVYARLATARLCDLNGSCFSTRNHRDLLSSVALPAAPRRDMQLHQARALAFEGNATLAASKLVTGQVACQDAEALCDQIALAALSEAQTKPAINPLLLYLGLPNRTEGPDAFELATLAAEVAAQLDAPKFAANLLASATGKAPADLLESHVYRTVEMYLVASDPARAKVVFEYAQSRFKKTWNTDPKWAELSKRLTAVEDTGALPISATPEVDRAKALLQQLSNIQKAPTASKLASNTTHPHQPPNKGPKPPAKRQP